MVVWKLLWTSTLRTLLLVWAVQCQEPQDTNEDLSPAGLSENVMLDNCPRQCKCPSDSTVNCASAELTEFPSGLSDRIQMLSLENNMIREVTVEHVSHLYWLETLNLQNNGLSSDVYLHNNKLTDAGLPEHMFNGSDSLELLIMSSNLLTEVPRNLPTSLHRLHLKNNRLRVIPAEAFANLSNLRELHLQDNQLNSQDIAPAAFSNLSSLAYLDLSNNNLSVVPSGLPKTLLLLHLERNSIHSIPANSLSVLRNLEYLLIHNNKLRSRAIHPTAFQGLKKLHTLHMYNNLLERVPRGMPRRAKTVMLLHNSISEIGRNDLSLLHTLTELNLSYNKLSSSRLHPEAFRKLRSLQTLDLSGNSLHSLPLGLPRSLQVLEIKNNHLNSIPAGALTGMDQLRRLILSNNQLKLNSAYQGAWLELSSLATLDLSGNLLSHIPPDLPESLQFLHLQNNRISSVPASAFDGTPNLQGLYLRFNRLTVASVDDSAFTLLPNLDIELDFELTFRQTEVAPLQEDEEEL